MNTYFWDFDLFALPEYPAGSEASPSPGQTRVLVFLGPEETTGELRAFLGNILQAVNVDLENETTSIVITPGSLHSCTSTAKPFAPQYILLFGQDPRQMGLYFALPPYQPVEHRGCTFLWADSLADIFEERRKGGKKKAGLLWGALKEAFDIHA